MGTVSIFNEKILGKIVLGAYYVFACALLVGAFWLVGFILSYKGNFAGVNWGEVIEIILGAVLVVIGIMHLYAFALMANTLFKQSKYNFIRSYGIYIYSVSVSGLIAYWQIDKGPFTGLVQYGNTRGVVFFIFLLVISFAISIYIMDDKVGKNKN